MTHPAPEHLDEALAAAARVVAAVPEDRWSAQTPCPDWNAAELVQHLAHGNLHAAARLQGDEGAVQPPALDDPVGGFERSAAALREAFEDPAVLERLVALPVGTVPGAVALDLRLTELLVHGWDLARATGQQLVVGDAVVQRALGFSRGFLDRIPPDRSPFHAPQPVAGDASALDELAGLLGRRTTG